MIDLTDIEINELPYKYIRLGNICGLRHFVIEICPKQNKGRIFLADSKELVHYQYEFDKKGIDELIKFLKMIEE